ncbi:MAG: diguanylate cyclase domain-containing protein [Magnetovibrionaceae bacterium]
MPDASESRDLDRGGLLPDLGFMERSSDLVCLIAAGRILRMNAAGKGFLQLDGIEAEGLSLLDFVAPEYREVGEDLFPMLLTENQPFPLKMIGREGRELAFRVNVVEEPDVGENVLILVAHDVTSTMRMAEAIHRSEQRYRALVGHALDLIAVVEEGLIRFVNPAGVQMLRAESEGVILGRSIEEFVQPVYRDLFEGELLASMLWDDELVPMKLLRADGAVIDCEVGLAPLDGRIGKEYMLEARDISGHNRHVAELSKLNRTLEQRVRDRTAELEAEIGERKRAEEQLRHAATHDALTGLPNRSLVMDRLGQAVLHARRSGTMVALLFIDLDRFKQVNDTLGHDAGDELLQLVAQRLKDQVRSSDTIGRLGGDEFIAVLDGLSDEEPAQTIGQAIVDRLGDPFFLPEGRADIGASVGIGLFPLDAEDPQSLLKRADEAMYHVKKDGRGTVRFFRDI